MKIEKGKISSSQLTFLIIGIVESCILTAVFISAITKQDTWIVLLIGFCIIALLLLVYTELGMKFKGKNLIEMNTDIYGNWIGNIISLLYIYFFWFLVPANIRFTADFLTSELFPETDITIFVVIIALVCMYTIKKGLEVIARISIFLTTILIIAAIFITVFSIQFFNFGNFLPMFQMSTKEFFQGINIMLAIPFGEINVCLMLFAYVNNTKQVRKASFVGLIIGAIFFLMITLRNIAVLGILTLNSTAPSYSVARLINIGDIITRTEVLVAVSIVSTMFLKICIIYYVTVLAIAQLFKMASYKSLIIPVGIISIILSITMYNSPLEEAYNASKVYGIYAIPFVVIFPVISLFIAQLKEFVRMKK